MQKNKYKLIEKKMNKLKFFSVAFFASFTLVNAQDIDQAKKAIDAEQFEKAMNAPQPEPRPPHQVEVFIHDSRLKSYGSQFGHVSIAVGNQLYSMSHSGLYQTNVNDFIKRQQNFRDTIGFVLNTTPAQAKAISEKMLEFDGTT